MLNAVLFFLQYFLNETLLSETFSGIGLALGLGFLVLTIVGGNIVMAALSVLTIIMIVVDVFAFTVLAGTFLFSVRGIIKMFSHLFI